MTSRNVYSHVNLTDAYDIAESNNNRLSVYSNASSSDSSQSGLARRSPSHNDNDSNNNNNNMDDTQSDNNSDYSSSESKSYRYLKKLRICTLIDIIGLVYRSLLPFSLWYDYFSDSTAGIIIITIIYYYYYYYYYLAVSTLIIVIYVCYKIADVAYTIRGAVEGIELFYSNRTEFGKLIVINNNNNNNNNERTLFH